MTHLKNNGIALVMHVLFVWLSFAFAIHQPMSDSVLTNAALQWGLVAICLLTYIACGFFLLRPVKSNAFLSTIAVTILVVITFIWLSFHYTWQSGIGGMLFATNPGLSILGLFAFLPKIIGNVASEIMLFILPLLPSLLIYLGMVLRKLFNGHKEKRINRNI